MACAEDHDLPLISADYAAMCQPESIDYMWFVIAVEALLLVVVLAKLGYDVWHYYKTGEMPWLANYICLGLGYSGEGGTGMIHYVLCLMWNASQYLTQFRRRCPKFPHGLLLRRRREL